MSSEYGEFSRKQKEIELEKEQETFRRLNPQKDNFMDEILKLCVALAWLVGTIGIINTVILVYMRFHHGSH